MITIRGGQTAGNATTRDLISKFNNVRRSKSRPYIIQIWNDLGRYGVNALCECEISAAEHPTMILIFELMSDKYEMNPRRRPRGEETLRGWNNRTGKEIVTRTVEKGGSYNG